MLFVLPTFSKLHLTLKPFQARGCQPRSTRCQPLKLMRLQVFCGFECQPRLAGPRVFGNLGAAAGIPCEKFVKIRCRNSSNKVEEFKHWSSSYWRNRMKSIGH